MTEKYNLPWHRVINSKGEISLTDEGLRVQRSLLENEGVVVVRERKINLERYEHEIHVMDFMDEDDWI